MRSYIRFMVWTTGILAVVCAVLYFTLFDVWTVPSDDPQFSVSIAPTMAPGDVVLVYRHSHPEWGQLVRCLDPDAPGRFVVGRIAATADDDLEVKDEILIVNHRPQSGVGVCDPARVTMVNPSTQLEEELACNRREFAGMETEYLRGVDSREKATTAKVDRGRVYLVSDNIHMHLDSRDFGQINPDTCQHVVYRLWSAKGWGDSAKRLTVIW